MFLNIIFRTDDPEVRGTCGIQKALGYWTDKEGGGKLLVTSVGSRVLSQPLKEVGFFHLKALVVGKRPTHLPQRQKLRRNSRSRITSI
jgi:hypothetical protein